MLKGLRALKKKSSSLSSAPFNLHLNIKTGLQNCCFFFHGGIFRGWPNVRISKSFPHRVSLDHLISTGYTELQIVETFTLTLLLKKSGSFPRWIKECSRFYAMNCTNHSVESIIFGLFIKAVPKNKTKQHRKPTMLKQSNADNTYGPGWSKKPILLLSRCSCFQSCSWLIEAFMQMKAALSFHLVHQMEDQVERKINFCRCIKIKAGLIKCIMWR